MAGALQQVNNVLPLYNTRLLAAYATLEPAAVQLVQAVKKWAKEKQVLSLPFCRGHEQLKHPKHELKRPK